MFGELMAVVGMANETNALAAGYRVEIDEQFKADASIPTCCLRTSSRPHAQGRATSKRLEKIDLLADCLQRLEPEEIEIAVALSVGRNAAGPYRDRLRHIRGTLPALPAEQPSLRSSKWIALLDEIAQHSGPRFGADASASCLTDCSPRDRRGAAFIIRLLVGEVRQGALEGIMLEALAKATGISG